MCNSQGLKQTTDCRCKLQQKNLIRRIHNFHTILNCLYTPTRFLIKLSNIDQTLVECTSLKILAAYFYYQVVSLVCWRTINTFDTFSIARDKAMHVRSNRKINSIIVNYFYHRISAEYTSLIWFWFPPAQCEQRI